MVPARFLTLVMVMLWGLAGAALAKADRVALVIGNSEYQAVTALQNAGNDANGIAAALRNIGFEVDVKFDLTNGQLSDAFRLFHRKATGAKIAIVYYAGHGIEIEKHNYLIPVDAQLERTADVFFEAVPMENAMLAVEGASELSLVILDACRNNPFAANMRRDGGTRSVGRGLALVEPSGNSLVAYAAKGGTTAFDGEGQNSPYAKALIEALQEPDVELSLLFRRVRDSVLEATNGEQEPFVYGSLSAKELFLNPGDSGARPAVPVPSAKDGAPVVAHLSQQFDPAFVTWGAIQSLERGPNQQRALKAFVEEFGKSPYAGAAKVMLRSYGVVTEPTPTPAAPAPVLRKADNPAPEDLSPTGEDVSLSRSQRRLVQRGLNAAGFSVGGADGIFGPRTRSAIVSWQDDNDLRVTSYLSLDQAEKLMALGEAAPVATPKPSAGAVLATPSKPVTVSPDNKKVASVAAPKPATGAVSGKMYLDMTMSVREDGRDVIKNFVSTVTVSSGKGRYQARNSDIGKWGPFIINATMTKGSYAFSGQLVGKSFAASGALINGNMTKKITLSKGGLRYRLLIRGRFAP